MTVHTEEELLGLFRVGRVVAEVLREVKRAARPGTTTAELDAIGLRVLQHHGARSAPQMTYGFPGTICLSVNDEVVHGIPGERRLQAGDLLKIDAAAELGGYIADATITVALSPVAPRLRRLSDCARTALDKALDVARAGRPVSDIGKAVAAEVRRQHFTVIPELTGHETGRRLHEGIDIPNYFDPGDERLLTPGLVITIEPIIAAGRRHVREEADGWTVKTVDRSPSAHFEHTIVVTPERPIVLTAL